MTTHRQAFWALLLMALVQPVKGVTLQILGSGGPELDDGRGSSSHIVWEGDQARLLVDAGPGSSVAFGSAGARFEDLQAVLLTHLHVDHAADFPAFVKGSFFTQRSTPLRVLGPQGNALMPSTTEFVDRLIGPQGAFAYLKGYLSEGGEDYRIEVADVALNRVQPKGFELATGIHVSALPVNHGPVAAVAWRVEIGGKALVFSGDTSNNTDALRTLAKDADVLIAHAAIPEGAGGVARRLHMPPSEIGMVASAAQVKAVVLSHFMSRSQVDQAGVKAVISKHFAGPVHLGFDGMKLALP